LIYYIFFMNNVIIWQKIDSTDVLSIRHMYPWTLTFPPTSIPIKPELISRVDGACARQLVNLTHNLSALDSGAQRSLVIYKFTSMKTTPEVLRDELSDQIWKNVYLFYLFCTIVAESR